MKRKTRRVRRRRFRGGDFLGQGTEGQVFKGSNTMDPPRAKCKATTIQRRNRIAKSSPTDITDREWNKTEFLRANPEFYSQFAIFPVERCESQEDGYSILFSEYGGVTYQTVLNMLEEIGNRLRRRKPMLNYQQEELQERFGVTDYRTALEMLIRQLDRVSTFTDTMNREQGIYHTDIKGDNLVFTPDGLLKLIDFANAGPSIFRTLDSAGLQQLKTQLIVLRDSLPSS